MANLVEILNCQAAVDLLHDMSYNIDMFGWLLC